MQASRRAWMLLSSASLFALNVALVGCTNNTKNVDPTDAPAHRHVANKENAPEDPPRNHGDEKLDEGARRDGDDLRRPIDPKTDRPHERDTPRDEKRQAKEIVMQEYKTPQGMIVKLNADHDPWADAVVSFNRGKPAPKKNENPWNAIGKPKGHSVALGHGGTLVVKFIDNVLIDGPGDDLVIFEAGKAIEPTGVAISEGKAKVVGYRD